MMQAAVEHARFLESTEARQQLEMKLRDSWQWVEAKNEAKRNKRRDARAARGKLAEKLFFSQRFEISLWRLAKALQKCFLIYTVDVLHSFLGCVPLTAVNAHVTPREWSSDTKIASKEDVPPNIYHII